MRKVVHMRGSTPSLYIYATIIGDCTGPYLDSNYRPKTTLLALRNTYGSHPGERMTKHLQEVIKDYRIGNKLFFLMADNASNNDKVIRLLEAHFDFIKLNPRAREAALR
jgi:hypothetical protein